MYISIGYVLVKIIISLKARDLLPALPYLTNNRNVIMLSMRSTLLKCQGQIKGREQKKKKKTKAIKNLLMTFLFRGVLALSLSLIPVLLPHGDNYAILLPGPVSFDPM